jgi:SAM-dependent methyltransferase
MQHPKQDQHWSAAAASYEAEYIDPYRPDIRNPLPRMLGRLGKTGSRVVADLGCGIGPLLPLLAGAYRRVYAVDFAAGMLARARKAAAGCGNVTFLHEDLTEFQLPELVDVAVAVNSLVMPDERDLDRSLERVAAALKPGGYFVGIVPAMDAVHYYTMLLVDRALANGQPRRTAHKNARHHADHGHFDFAFGQFLYEGLEQHFWQPFEVRYRFRRAGLRLRRLRKLHLSWEQFAGSAELRKHPAPWDWLFVARRLRLDRSSGR